MLNEYDHFDDGGGGDDVVDLVMSINMSQSLLVGNKIFDHRKHCVSKEWFSPTVGYTKVIYV